MFARVERELGVAEVPAALAGRNAAMVRRGAERLGWSGGYVRRNARACQGSGVCAFGCPTGAKQHAGAAYVPKAQAAGATVVTGARAQRVLMQDEEIDMSRGVPQSYFVDEFAGDRIPLETISGPPDCLAMAVPFTGDRQRELMLAYRRIGQCGLMVSDRSRGRVHRLLGRPVVRYDLNRHDVATVKAGLERLAELLWAAGARSVVLPVGRLRELFGLLGARVPEEEAACRS